MKKIFWICSLAIICASCNDDLTVEILPANNGNHSNSGEGNEFNRTITAKVENGSLYNFLIKRVRAASYANDDDNGTTLASGNFSSGGFTLTLPQTVSAQQLELMAGLSFNAANVSDKNAKGTTVDIEGFASASGAWSWADWEGDFIYGKVSSTSIVYAYYLYVDRNVTIKGTGYNVEYEYEEKYDLTLKTGWNMAYFTVSIENISYSTTAVSGLKWYYDEDFEDLMYSIMGINSLSTPKITSLSKLKRHWKGLLKP